LQGQPLGYEILAAALDRLRHEQGAARLNPARIGLVRMCVNDIEKSTEQGGHKMGEALNVAEEQPAYIFGRLLALYEAIQYQAHRDPDDPNKEVNVNVTDKYFGLASTYPQLAFPKLENLSKAHFR